MQAIAAAGTKAPAAGAYRRDASAPTLAGSRALVPLNASPVPVSCRPMLRPLPAFLAHLVATAQHAPQTRTLRRAAPAEAAAAYERMRRVVRAHP
jgi:hypothetical protein